MKVLTLGIDLAKNVFSLHGVDQHGKVMICKTVKRHQLLPEIARLPEWNHWDNLITLFDYPDDIRKAIYTTNAIESLNSVIRKAVRQRKIFPTDNSVMKVIYLAMERASAKWTMPIRNWKAAMNRFEIMFPDRFRQ